tara:strand:- start:48 stop:644 length:597 start_codon:yes stop_codon:yes gene_type:complete
MNILAIDTATDLSSISLFINNKIVDTIKHEKVLSHSKVLATSVALIIKKNKFDICNLDLILLSIGPGSYSGLRVSSSFSKGLALALSKPIIPINTISAMSFFLENSGNYYVALYSHRDYVFYQEFLNGKAVGKQYCKKYSSLKSIKIYGYNISKIENIKSIDCQPSSVNLINYFFENKENLMKKELTDINPIYINKSK